MVHADAPNHCFMVAFGTKKRSLSEFERWQAGDLQLDEWALHFKPDNTGNFAAQLQQAAIPP
jgi:hypothetical protein